VPLNVTVDDGLIGEALRLASNGREDEIVGAALEEEIKHRHRLRILDLFGKVEYYEDYDYKQGRRKR